MDQSLLFLLTASSLLLAAPPLVAGQFNCDDCTIRPHLPCRVIPLKPEECLFHRDPNLPEVGPVRNINVSHFARVRNEINARPYLNVSWEIPTKGFKDVTGFRITLFDKLNPGTPRMCIHLDMGSAMWTDADRQQELLYFDCLEINWDTAYILTILSFPNQPERSPTTNIKEYYRPYVNDKLPAEWITSINVTTIDNKQQVSVAFQLFPSNKYSFIQYKIKLENEKNPAFSRYITIDQLNMTMPVTFFNVCAQGYWIVKVTPTKMGGGLCTENDGVPCISDQTVCAPCTVSRTKRFRYDPVNPCHEDSFRNKIPTLVATIVGICAGCLVASIFMGIIMHYSQPCRRQRRQEIPVKQSVPRRQRNNEGGALSTKRVLILYEEDHQLHMDVVHHLASFLQHNCKCDIMMDRWDQQAVRKDPTAWLMKHLDSHISDKIIFIHSEGGYRKFYARNEGESYESAVSPHVDLFVPGVKHIITERLRGSGYFESSKNTISVYFPYTPKEFVITETSPDCIYPLMTDIDSLLNRIHEDNPAVREIIGKVTNGKYTDQCSGCQLAAAIDKMSNLVKMNPDWFSAAHRKIPREDNDDSGRGTLQGKEVHAILQENLSSQPPTEVLVEENQVGEMEKARSKKELKEPDHVKDNRQAAARAENPVSSSRVSLLRQSFEVKPNSPQSQIAASREKVRAHSKQSQSSKSSDSSRENLAYIKEDVYATPLPKSERSSKASFSDGVRDDDVRVSFLKNDNSRPTSASSNDPLYAEVNEGNSPMNNSGKKNRKRSVPDYSAIVDSAFADALYGQSMGEPES